MGPRHRIRCPAGVGAPTPLVNRPLTLPYTYSPAASPRDMEKNGRLPPWALHDDIPGDIGFMQNGQRSAREPLQQSLPRCPGASPRELVQEPEPQSAREALLVGSAGGLMPGTSGNRNRLKKEPPPPPLPTLGIL